MPGAKGCARWRRQWDHICLLPLQVTPLHTDPYHNLLSQVVGRKYVRLYHPQATPQLYPFDSGFTTNCSQVHVLWVHCGTEATEFCSVRTMLP